ncbi:MAG: hypothetical protein ACFCU8_05045 [Thermosynechococcaceae cyanobacterium]
MTKISVSVSEELLTYLDQNVGNRSALIETLLTQWRRQREDQEFAQACALIDELELGWDHQWQQAAITDWEASES